MSDAALRTLAEAAGIALSWRDVFGQTHDVAPPSLRAVLSALGLPAETDEQIADSLMWATTPPNTLPPLVTADLGEPVDLPAPAGSYRLTLEDGRVFDGITEVGPSGARIPPILEIGYHHLLLNDAETCIAVAPPSCFTLREAVPGGRGWGLAAQLYALRRPGDGGLGDFQALADLAAPAAKLGAQAIAISPVHAQFSADLDRFSPYAPSSRTVLNVLHGTIDAGDADLEALPLVDWPRASRLRLGQFRAQFVAEQADPAARAAFEAFARKGGERLRVHAVFETLHAHFFGRDPKSWHWRSWPAAYQDSGSAAVRAFADSRAEDVDFHIWLQFHAERGLAAAQKACRDAGMGIGLVTDLAVGADSGGSQCWSRTAEALLGLSVGAPPDLLQRDGQDWGLTGFSPRGMVTHGFATYRHMLQTALANAGGMRIDHAMGLNRLWVIPEGAMGSEGAYLSYPERDLMRLVRLESRRHRAIVLAEDLGTVPEGFQDRLLQAGISGLRVLWFQRSLDHGFVAPSQWTPGAAAMTSTHDLPTLAGWWHGRDLDWDERLGKLPDPAKARADRARDKTLAWQAFQYSGAANSDQPGDAQSAVFADAACAHVGRSACELVMLPLEDALGLVEQPNIPGTIEEHPNWRRRMPEDARTMLDDPGTQQRLTSLQNSRT
jgi:4-alpha-glucanotransferase